MKNSADVKLSGAVELETDTASFKPVGVLGDDVSCGLVKLNSG